MPIIAFFRALFLSPLSWIWEWTYIVRRVCYSYGIISKNYFKVPIISVGNLTFGGTGKTPVTIWLTELMNELQLRPMILTRGYKGKYENSFGIIYGGELFRNNPIDFGDEPLLIARRLKSGAVVVGKKRSENLKYYFDDVKPHVVLLDDGFQHLKLHQNFSVVLFDALLPMEQYKTAPLGYLREGPTALKDADAIVISRADQVSKEKLKELKEFIKPYIFSETVIAEIKYGPTGLYNTHFEKVHEVTRLKDRNVIALAAIASPDSFFKVLENHGAKIVDKIVFPDHYFFSSDDINEILLKATEKGAMVVASEKDIVKIRRISIDAKILYIDVQIQFLSGEEELTTKIKKVILGDSL